MSSMSRYLQYRKQDERETDTAHGALQVPLPAALWMTCVSTPTDCNRRRHTLLAKAAYDTLRGRSPSQHAKLLLPTQCMGSCRQGLPMLLQDEGWPWNSPERGMRVLAPSSSSSAHAELAVLALAAS